MSEPLDPTPAPTATTDKAELRTQLLARRRALADELGPQGWADLADRIAATGTAWLTRYADSSGRPDAPRGWTVTSYQPRRTEPPVDRFTRALVDAGVRVLMPITLPAGRLDWCDVTDPDASPLGAGVLAEVDVAFTPGLAVDPRGVRLGKGGGYYDRALASLRPGIPTVTVLHEHELLDHVPALPHDTPVWGTLTAAGCGPVAG